MRHGLGSTETTPGPSAAQRVRQQLADQVEPAAVGRDLILGQLAGFTQPAVGVAVKPTPVKEGVQIDRATTQLNAVLLQPTLQLNILLLCRRHIPKAGGPRYR